MSNIEDTVRRVLDLAAAYRLAEHPQASLTELEAAIRTALSAEDGEAVADYSEMSREALERHAARMAQSLANDAPRKFYDKHATGAMLAPSCLCCGQLPEEIAITHLELPGIVVCRKCHGRALGVIGGAGGVPAGWKLALVKPDETMIEAGIAARRNMGAVEDVYRAMLNAAPQPAAARQDVGEQE